MTESTENLVDRVAIMMAIGNNGGIWVTHYTDSQKFLWRMRAATVIAEVHMLLAKSSPPGCVASDA
jgi:hypothetical protein